MKRYGRDAFSLIEVLISLPIGILVLALVLIIVGAQTNLVGRNFASNVAHLNLLSPLQRFNHEVHMSVSDPTLTSALSGSGSYTLVSGTGPAAVVKLDLFLAGPFAVHSTAKITDTSISIEPNGSTFVIKPGMCIRIPSYKDSTGSAINRKITSVTHGSVVTLGLESALGAGITTTGGTGGGVTGTQIVPLYITVPVFYYVSNKTLIRQDGVDLASSSGTKSLVLPGLATTVPFTKPDSTNGRFLGLTLSTYTPEYSARKYESSGLMVNELWIPARGQLYP